MDLEFAADNILHDGQVKCSSRCSKTLRLAGNLRSRRLGTQMLRIRRVSAVFDLATTPALLMPIDELLQSMVARATPESKTAKSCNLVNPSSSEFATLGEKRLWRSFGIIEQTQSNQRIGQQPKRCSHDAFRQKLRMRSICVLFIADWACL